MALWKQGELLTGGLRPSRFKYSAIAVGRAVLGDKKTIQINGVSADFIAPEIHNSLDFVPNSEQRMLERFVNSISSDTVVWDVGGELGIYSCLSGQAGAEYVHAFEPRSNVGEKLRLHMVINGIRGSLHSVAFGEYDESMTKWLENNAPHARMTDADSFAKTHSNPDVVKVDIEGGEIGFLRGFERTLDETPPQRLFIELHPKGSHSQTNVGLSTKEIDEVHNRLVDAGYETEEIGQRDGQRLLDATRTDQ